MSSQLPNYLRAHRKRLALSQHEVAFLLGAQSGAKICRYERFIREPGLQTVLAFEIIFQKSIREIFAGLHGRIEQQVAARARMLSREMHPEKTGRHVVFKRETLARLSGLSIKKANQ